MGLRPDRRVRHAIRQVRRPRWSQTPVPAAATAVRRLTVGWT